MPKTVVGARGEVVFLGASQIDSVESSALRSAAADLVSTRFPFPEIRIPRGGGILPPASAWDGNKKPLYIVVKIRRDYGREIAHSWHSSRGIHIVTITTANEDRYLLLILITSWEYASNFQH